MNRIWELQREYIALPAVYGVWVRCAGEETLNDLYDSKEAATLCRDYYNAHNQNGYLGKATVRLHRVATMAIAQKRFAGSPVTMSRPLSGAAPDAGPTSKTGDDHAKD